MPHEIFVNQGEGSNEVAIFNARRLKQELGLPSIGVELVVNPNNSGFLLGVLARGMGVHTAIAAARVPPVPEPEVGWTLGDDYILGVAIVMGATYVSENAVQIADIQQRELLTYWARKKKFLLAQENGLGPQDGEPFILSWDVRALAQHVKALSGLGANIGALLDVDMILRNRRTLPDISKRYSLFKAWAALKPRIIRFAYYEPHEDELADLIQSSSSFPRDTVYTVKAANLPEAYKALGFVLKNFRGKSE